MKDSDFNEILKDFLLTKREEAQLSQSEVAARSDVPGVGKTLDQRAVSRIEDNPLGADNLKIAGYLYAVGVDIATYYNLFNEHAYEGDKRIMETLKNNSISQRLEDSLARLDTIKTALDNFNHEYINALGLTEKFDDLSEYIQTLNRKPIIGCFGHFDAGKSTLLNTVIHDNLLPEKYQPATCVVNLIMHIDDRPDSINGTVAVFKKGFKPYMIHSQEAVNDYLIEQGGGEVLSRLGVHNYDEQGSNDAYIAIAFVQAEILKKVWLLDTPGDLNSTDDSDTEKALGGVELADGILFVSSHNGFLKDTDLGFAANIIRQRPPVDKDHPLAHILFIQSHCHSEIKQGDIDTVSRVTFKRIEKQLNSLIFDEWVSDGKLSCLPHPSDLTERTQPFWRENNIFRTSTLKRIVNMTEFLVENQLVLIDANIAATLKQANGILQSAIHNLEQKKADSKARIQEVKEQEARFREESIALKAEFEQLIQSCEERKINDIEGMTAFFEYKTSPESLEKLIRETYSDKKGAQSGVGSYVGQLLSAKLESILKSSGKLISAEVDSLLSRWQKAIPVAFADSQGTSKVDDLGSLSAFDVRAVFIGGFAGLASLGAMALYVSTIASNLGAYILVGKVAGVLVSLGLVGHVTTVTSFVAAIGGPITIGIVIASIIGLCVYKLFGRSWEKSLAKKVSEAVQAGEVEGKLYKTIKEYWANTKKAIESGFKELESQTEKYIADLNEDAERNYDHEKINVCIGHLQSLIQID